MSLKSESFCETEDEEKYEPGKSCEKRDETIIEVKVYVIVMFLF